MKQITTMNIQKYKDYLFQEEKSIATIEKYIRDINAFYHFLPTHKSINKESVIAYKQHLQDNYKPTSGNRMLVALHSFLSFLKLNNFKVKLFTIQTQVFSNPHKELTKNEYIRLLQSAKSHKNERLYMLIQTICSTGIRVSEHKYISVQSLQEGKTTIHNKGKTREVYFPTQLKKSLLIYCQKNNIKKGSIFISKRGHPLDRSNIWKMMKQLCKDARVDEVKVYPHNLRHLFAFTYYQLEKDIVRLASVLGHASIETTRIYTMSSGSECTKVYSRMGLHPLSLE